MLAGQTAAGRTTRELMLFASGCAGLGLLLIVAAVVDPRALANGEGVWLKPIRFALAFAVHAVTLAWIARLTARASVGDGLFAVSARLQIAVMFVELVCILTQAGRGVASHFNYATPFDRAIFTIMGLGTAALFVGFALILAGLMRRPGPPLAGWAAGIAMVFASLGGLAGIAMVMPTAAQAALLDTGIRPDVIGSHLVGTPSGGKLPFFSWELTAGDWRAPHFLGLHALQVLPLIAWLGERARSRGYTPVLVATIGYGLLFAWACAQTISGQPVFTLAAGNVVAVTLSTALYLIALRLALGKPAQLSEPHKA